MALVDIDNFRLLNDTYGHPAGDRALVEVARILRDVLPDRSVLGRYGPDEFIVVTAQRTCATSNPRSSACAPASPS